MDNLKQYAHSESTLLNHLWNVGCMGIKKVLQLVRSFLEKNPSIQKTLQFEADINDDEKNDFRLLV